MGYGPCDPCFNPCYNFDPCYDPCGEYKTEPQAKLAPIPDGSNSPLPTMEGKTSPIEVLKESVIESPIKEGDTSPLPEIEKKPMRFFDGTEEIKPNPDMPLPAPFDNKWKEIGRTPKLKIHYKYKVEEIEYLTARTPKGRFLNLPVINGMLPTATIGEDQIDVYYRGKRATAKFWKDYNAVGYCQYHKPIDVNGWHVYTGQPMRDWTYLKTPFKGMLHSAKKTNEEDANVRFLTFNGDLVIVRWSDLSREDQSYISGSYNLANK